MTDMEGSTDLKADGKRKDGHGPKNKRKDGWMDGWMDGWNDQ